jgi:TPR repeat protein
MLAFAVAGVLSAPALAAGEYETGLAAYDEAVASRMPDHPAYARAFDAWSNVPEDQREPALRYHLGMMYYFGIGGAAIDQVGALELIRGAGDDGYALADAFFALLHEKGDGMMVRNDPQHALVLYERAAAGNNCAALKRLAAAYENGELGLAPDPEHARSYAERVPDCVRR